MGPIGTPEILIILVIVVLLFGAKKIPDLARSVGEGLREFKKSVQAPIEEATKPTSASRDEAEPSK